MKLSKKLRILIIVTVSVLLIAGGVMSFFAFHFYIPLDRQIRKMIYSTITMETIICVPTLQGFMK